MIRFHRNIARSINVNACGRAKRLTRRVWPYHWRDKRTDYSGQLQYPSTTHVGYYLLPMIMATPIGNQIPISVITLRHGSV